ncbi:flotillin-like FloA family protein [Carboxylicivirga sp. RSCT41]|uniref:flotillin-like FloA family protein n=1 Tax=Carboxylicivirga agarovorans TaxID=3417570 RepID=UPI003D330952
MEILIIILLLFFTILLGLPLLVTILRAKAQGANISFKQALGLNFRKTNKKNLFKALALTQNNKLDLELVDLEAHLLAGGNTYKVIQTLIKHQDKKDFTFQMLTALDLAGKDIEDAVLKTTEIHTLSINDLDFKSFKINLWAEYKHGMAAAFGAFDEQNNSIEEKVKEKLTAVARDWTSTDTIASQNFIRNNILNTEYWERVLGVQLIQQKLILKK